MVSTIREILAPGTSGNRMNPDTTLDLPVTPTAPAPAPEVDASVSFDAKSSNSAKGGVASDSEEHLDDEFNDVKSEEPSDVREDTGGQPDDIPARPEPPAVEGTPAPTPTTPTAGGHSGQKYRNSLWEAGLTGSTSPLAKPTRENGMNGVWSQLQACRMTSSSSSDAGDASGEGTVSPAGSGISLIPEGAVTLKMEEREVANL